MSCNKKFGVMLDMSRNAVMKLSELKKFAKILRSFGYNMIQLYIEDTYEVLGEPCFGYMRGRYSAKELADIVDFCDSIGIEVIPCIQTLAHLNQIFEHNEYAKIKDTADILLVGDDRTYELIENMVKTVKSVFKSEYIHVGMDEAHMLGLGKYLDKNGYRNRFDIFSEHLERVIDIAKKYGLTPIIWSDMFFRLANHGGYYTRDDIITEEIVSKCPDGVELNYWDYYHVDAECYDNMIQQHKKFGKNLWFAGGAWSWNGFAPFNEWSIKSMKVAMQSCANNNVDNICITMWGDDGKECSFYALLPSLFAVRKMYEGVTDEGEIKRLFKNETGEDFDAMMALDLPNKVSPNKNELSNVSKVMLYNDPLVGMFDVAVDKAAAEEFKSVANTLYGYAKDSKYSYVFECEAALCELLSVKYDLGMRAREAYKANDREVLMQIVGDFDRASELLEVFYRKFETLWMKENKPFGFEVQEIRLGGLMLRLRSAKERLVKYLDGEISVIEEYEVELLDYNALSGTSPRCNHWTKLASPNVI